MPEKLTIWRNLIPKLAAARSGGSRIRRQAIPETRGQPGATGHKLCQGLMARDLRISLILNRRITEISG